MCGSRETIKDKGGLDKETVEVLREKFRRVFAAETVGRPGLLGLWILRSGRWRDVECGQ